MNLDPAAKGVVLLLIWSQPGREWPWQPKGTWGQHLKQTGTKYAQEMFQNTKELCEMSSKKSFWNLAWWQNPCTRNKSDESYTQIRNGNENKIQAYQPPLRRPQSEGMWLHPKGGWDKNGSEEGYPFPGRESLIRQPPAWLSGSQPQINTQITVTEVLQKGCYINPNPERERNEKGTNVCWWYILPIAEHGTRSFGHNISFYPHNNSNKVTNGPTLELIKPMFLKIK